MMTAAVAGGAAVVALVLGLLAGQVWQRRRHSRAAVTAEELVGDARRRAQETLSRADDQARAKAQAFREREEAALEHRHLEIGVHEQRLEQREATLEQRASNLAQRETLLLQREREAGDSRLEADRLREQARAELEQPTGGPGGS
jgi:ribonuclease Y